MLPMLLLGSALLKARQFFPWGKEDINEILSKNIYFFNLVNVHA